MRTKEGAGSAATRARAADKVNAPERALGAPPDERRTPVQGKMLWFNEAKNFGFIRTEEGERLYVHRDGFLPGDAPVGRCAGVAVTFNVSSGEPERKAVDVVIVREEASKRARSHGRGVGHAG